MAESIDRKPEDNTPAKIKERLTKLRQIPPEERTEAHQVPRWVKHAFAKIEILGYTYAEAAKEFNRSPKTLQKYKMSPWVKEWRKALAEKAADPERVADMVMKASLFEAALDQVWAIETAKEKNDYKEVRLGTKDILTTHGILKPQGTRGPTHAPIINIQLPASVDAGALAPVEVQTEVRLIEAEVIEIEDE